MNKYGQFHEEHLKKIAKGLQLFNEKKYWECHEELEEWWIEDKADMARYVYWAVIQVAAAMVHYRESNLIGAQELMKKAKEKFKKAEEFQVETPLLEESLGWAEFKKLVFSTPDQPTLEDLQPIFEFQFKNFL